MRIVVCVKAVPDTNAALKVGADKKTINPQGVKYVMSPYDAVAVSKAVEVKEANAGSELIAISVGKSKTDAAAEKRIKDALALGADKGINIADDADHRDSLSIAKALTAAIKSLGDVDLVMFGRQAVDSQSLAVGPMVAQMLGIPFIMDATEATIADGKVSAKRSAEARVESIEASLPCAISAQRGLAEERYAKLKDILKAKKKPVEAFAFEFPEAAAEVTEMTPPPERKAGKIVGEGPEAAAELVRLLQDEAKSLSF